MRTGIAWVRADIGNTGKGGRRKGGMENARFHVLFLEVKGHKICPLGEVSFALNSQRRSDIGGEPG